MGEHRSDRHSSSRRYSSSHRHRDSSEHRPRNLKQLREQLERKRKRKTAPRETTDYSKKYEILQQEGKNSLFDVRPGKLPLAVVPTPGQDRQLQAQAQMAGIDTRNRLTPKLAKSIYIAGLDTQGLNDRDLFEFFNSTIDLVTGKKLNAVVSIYLNKKKKFAFLEVNDYNLATSIIQNLNGVKFKGMSLNLRRPANYVSDSAPPPGEIPPMDVTKVGMLRGKPSSFVENSPEKVYVAGIPYDISEEQLQELLESYGRLASLCIIKDKGYAFCQYKDPNVTDEACKGLNGIPVRDNILTVKRADVNKPLAQTTDGQKADPNRMINQQIANQHIQDQGTVRMLEVQGGGGGKAISSRFIMLTNMVTENDFASKEAYDDLYADVKQECSQYGRVIKLIIPQPQRGYKVKGVGKIFLEFSTELEALDARAKLETRLFDGKKLEAVCISGEEFHSYNN
eukprot:snap_masked-scaffold_14-processed-gene-11.16-mRNA-1 protein AED:0.40 eAED:0.40 QI:0/-1/0/1/-1/1/1/0/452